VDIVAIILACSLALLVILILIATLLQIVNHSRPPVRLSSNASQVLTAAIGAVAGLLGGYIGSQSRKSD
jgi:uncharacterized membrane protein YfcA